MTKDEALKMALEALNDLATWNDGEVGSHMDEPYAAEVARLTITAIKEALAQPEQEYYAVNAVHKGEQCYVKAQPEQEPVKFEAVWDSGPTNKDYEDAMRLKRLQQLTTPPQRKPLTDEEIILIVAECAASHQHTDIHFARAIERAHGIKELV